MTKSGYLFLYISFLFLQSCGQTQKESADQKDLEPQFYTLEDFGSVEKYDVHVHINVDDTTFMEQAKEDNFRLLTINVNPSYYPPIEEQRSIALEQIESYPQRLAYATTFTVSGIDNPQWLPQTLRYLKESFEKGAIAVKVWKNIGMDIRDKEGKFIMIDDPRFDPVLDFIEENDVTLIGHLGEPRNAWLPIEEMTISGDKRYFSENPEFHMHQHPEFPSYEEQIEARDRMLEKHPNLRFVGAHLGSLEWNVDELARHLDEFPNVSVDMAARVSHLKYQAAKDWQKVHNFIIKYQDRLLYATDLSIRPTTDPIELKKRMHETWLRDWKFFVTDEKMNAPHFEGDFNGLKLPRPVVDKIFRKNAEHSFPGFNRTFLCSADG